MLKVRQSNGHLTPLKQPTLFELYGQAEPSVDLKNQHLMLKKRKHDTASGASLFRFFKQPSAIKNRERLDANIAMRQSSAPTAAIVVSYREDGAGRGAFFDHLALQTITKNQTAIAKHETQNLIAFTEHNQSITYHLPLEVQSNSSIDVGLEHNSGLLYIPGVSSKVYSSPAYQDRKAFEFDLIRKARNTGQPILGICAGSWVIWEQFRGTITAVAEHNYRAGMPRASETTGKISHNKLIHDIEVQSSALLLQAALKSNITGMTKLPVNSVHSFAPDQKKIPSGLIISARSVQNDTIAPFSPHTRTQANNCTEMSVKIKMKPEEDTIEGFESAHGAPILGIQWHPEAFTHIAAKDYFAEHQQHLIKYMTKAGQTYLQRQGLNQKLQSLLKPDSTMHPLLKRTELISQYNNVIKTTRKGITQFSLYKLQPGKTLRHQKEALAEIQIKERYLEEKGAHLVSKNR